MHVDTVGAKSKRGSHVIVAKSPPMEDDAMEVVVEDEARGGALSGRSDRLGDGESFGTQPENSSEKFSDGRRWPESDAGKRIRGGEWGEIVGSAVVLQFGTEHKSPICGCLKGFVPVQIDWSKEIGQWDVVIRSELLCEKNQSSLASGKSKPDKLQVLKGLKLLDRYHYFPDKKPMNANNGVMDGYSKANLAIPRKKKTP
ncbi:hypothetical protein Tco_0867877 [Tanacetum coccineum]